MLNLPSQTAITVTFARLCSMKYTSLSYKTRSTFVYSIRSFLPDLWHCITKVLTICELSYCRIVTSFYNMRHKLMPSVSRLSSFISSFSLKDPGTTTMASASPSPSSRKAKAVFQWKEALAGAAAGAFAKTALAPVERIKLLSKCSIHCSFHISRPACRILKK